VYCHPLFVLNFTVKNMGGRELHGTLMLLVHKNCHHHGL
jgi:hypothetical protein